MRAVERPELMLLKAIRRVHYGESISVLFQYD